MAIVLMGSNLAYIGSKVSELVTRVFLSVKVAEIYESQFIDRRLVDDRRRQLRAKEVAVVLRRMSGSDIVLGLVDYDAYVPGLNFVFGIALPSLKVAVVFLARLRTPSHRLFTMRVFKEVLHELGHVFGLDHCAVPRCVMNFSNSVIEVDLKSMFFCKHCAKKLAMKGLEINRKYIME